MRPHTGIMSAMSDAAGKIIIQPGANVWPHELLTAEALAAYGYTVELIKKRDGDHQQSADAYLDGVLFEMKAPTGGHLSVVGKNIKKALGQSYCIVFDSKRMKNVRDHQVLRELRKQLELNRKIKSLLFVDKKRTVTKLR